MALIFVGLGFMGIIAATMLAIDVGMLMTARAQAQNSADAGALAGAIALAFDDYNDRSPSGPAVTSALDMSRANLVMRDVVSVTSNDVEFLQDPSGEPNRVRVTVHRRSARGNPVATLTAGLFGIPTADIIAAATAEAAPANAESCVKPFTIPDRWTENQTPPWDGDDTFDVVDNKGRPLANPDVYVPATEPGYTGYDPDRDRGLRRLIRAGTGNNITPSFYFSITIGGGTGADDYRWNIANCNDTVMRWGEPMIQEPGNMVGPTIQGANALMAKDPNAYWDSVCQCVRGSAYGGGTSPRVFPIPLFDPLYYETGKQEGRTADLKVANWIGFFLEDVVGNNLYGRVTPIGGMIRGGAGPAPDNAFPKAIRLVQ